MNARRRDPGGDAERLLERGVPGRLSAKSVGLESRAVENAEVARRREVVRQRGGGIPHLSFTRRLGDRTREAARASGGEILDRVEGVPAEPVRESFLAQTIS